MATRPGIRRHTATAAGPDRAPWGRPGGTALWCAARRLRLQGNESHPDSRKRSDRGPHRIARHPGVSPRRHAEGRRQGDRRRTRPGPEFRRRCIARSNKGIGSNFTVRKISFGEGVERVFPLYSPAIDSIEVVRRGAVRRAKLYYLRGRRGKSARIAERRDPRPPKNSEKNDI